jgi:hypothetical protein
VTLDAFKAGLRFFLARNGGKPSTTIEHLAIFLKSVAKYGAGAHAETLGKMGAIIRDRLAVKRVVSRPGTASVCGTSTILRTQPHWCACRSA